MSHVINLAQGDEALPPLHCPRCGELNAAKARVCLVCGAALPENVEEAANETEEIREEDDFVPAELEDFGIVPEEPYEAPQKPPPIAPREENYDDFGNEVKPPSSPLKAFVAGFVIVGLAILALRPATPPPETNRALEDAPRATPTQRKSEPKSEEIPAPTLAASSNNANAIEELPPGVENVPQSSAATAASAPAEAISLTTAAQMGDNAEVKRLLDAKADINLVDARGWTPLMNAAASGKLETVRLLIERGADVNIQAPDSTTALSLAEKAGNADIIKALEDVGAK